MCYCLNEREVAPTWIVNSYIMTVEAKNEIKTQTRLRVVRMIGEYINHTKTKMTEYKK